MLTNEETIIRKHVIDAGGSIRFKQRQQKWYGLCAEQMEQHH